MIQLIPPRFLARQLFLWLAMSAAEWVSVRGQLAPLEPISSYQLPYACSQVVVLPGGREFVGVDYTGNRVVRVQLASGELVGEFGFTNRIARIAVTPDGRRLYVGLTTLPNPCRTTEPATQEGLLSEIDLRAGTPPVFLPIGVDPFDLVALDRRVVAVSSCSGQAAGLVAYDLATGELLGRAPLFARSPLTLHPDQQRIYAADNPWPDFALARFDIPSSGGPPVASTRRAVGSQPQLWFLPGADRMVTQDNQVFELSTDAGADLKPVSRLPGEWCFGYAPWPDLGVLYRLSQGPVLGTLALDTFHLKWLSPLRHELLRGELAQIFATASGLCLVHFGETDRTRVEFFASFPTNAPPVASFVVRPEGSISTYSDVRLDASGSTDQLDAPGAGLLFRWDLDGDGSFETDYETNSVRLLRFRSPGLHSIGLEVMDGSGATDRVRRTLEVVDNSDHGLPGEPHEPWVINQEVRDGVFDEAGGWFYGTGVRGDLLKLSLRDGLVARRWEFDSPLRPHALAMMPGARRLYVGLEVPGSEEGGYLAEFDLAAAVKIQEYPVRPFPAMLVASPDGIVAIHSGGLRNATLAMYRAAFGERLDETELRGGVRLAIHPEGRMLVAVGDGVDTLSLDPATGHLGEMVPLGFGLAGTTVGRPVFLPGGTNVIFPNGQLYPCTTTSIDTGTPPRFVGLDQLRDAVTLADRGLMALINESTIVWLRYPGLTQLVVRPAPAVTTAAGTFGGKLALAAAEPDRTRILVLNPPATSPGENQSPAVELIEPADGLVMIAPADITLEADARDDDGAVRSVTFLIDGREWLYLEPASPVQTRYRAIWNNPGLGEHVVKVRVEDNLGAITESPGTRVIYNLAPTVRFASPQEGETILTPTNLVLEVQADDPDGRLERVEFFLAGSNSRAWLGTLTNAPYRLVLTNFIAFDGNFMVQAVDDRGSTCTAMIRPVLRGPEGDDYRRPFPTAGSAFNARSVNDNATVQSGEPLFRDPTVANSIIRTLHHSQWWTWTAPTNGLVTLSTLGSSFDTLLAVYLLPGTVVAANDDAPGAAPASRVKFTATQGMTYLLGVGGAQTNESGTLLLSLQLTPLPDTGVPTNDRFANRATLAGTTNSVARINSTAAASAEVGEPSHAGNAPRHSVWWTWRSPGRGQVSMSTQGSDFDTVLAVYRGSVLTSLVPFAANDDASPTVKSSRLDFQETTASGSTYVIAADGFGGAVGSLVLTVRWEPAPDSPGPPNDDFANATAIQGPLLTLIGSTTQATVEPGEPAHLPGGAAPHASVWWRWTSFGDNPVYLICTAGYPHALAAYTGSKWDELRQVGNAASTAVNGTTHRAVVNFFARAGIEYRIALDAIGSAGAFELNLNGTMPLEQPVLLWAQPAPGQAPQLRIRIGRPSTINLEESQDLRSWKTLDRLYIPNETTLAIPLDTSTRFLRAVADLPGGLMSR